ETGIFEASLTVGDSPSQDRRCSSPSLSWTAKERLGPLGFNETAGISGVHLEDAQRQPPHEGGVQLGSLW
ncbi:hypothetical protein JOQ06_015400, partial [Pogonophryne albipinna]